MTHEPFGLLYLPHGVTREQLQRDPSISVVFVNSARTALAMVAQGHAAILTPGVSEVALAKKLRGWGAQVTTFGANTSPIQ